MPTGLVLGAPTQTVAQAQYQTEDRSYDMVAVPHTQSVRERQIEIGIVGIHGREVTVIHRLVQADVGIVLGVVGAHGRHISARSQLQILISFVHNVHNVLVN